MGRIRQAVRQRKQTIIQRKMGQVEAIRYAIPTDVYIQVMHVAATTGQLMVIDPETYQPLEEINEETGKLGPVLTPLGTKDRMDQMKYMVDKAMPNRLPSQDHLGETPPDTEALTNAALNFEDMTQEQLLTHIEAAPEAPTTDE